MRRVSIAIAAGLTLGSAAVVQAHHSFAVYFDPDKIVEIEGTVTSFRFSNPHAMIAVDVPTKGGKTQEWRIETNSPTILMRRGWRRDSLKGGQKIKIVGWGSRDGRPYMRLREARRPDGSLVGAAPFDQTDG